MWSGPKLHSLRSRGSFSRGTETQSRCKSKENPIPRARGFFPKFQADRQQLGLVGYPVMGLHPYLVRSGFCPCIVVGKLKHWVSFLELLPFSGGFEEKPKGQKTPIWGVPHSVAILLPPFDTSSMFPTRKRRAARFTMARLVGAKSMASHRWLERGESGGWNALESTRGCLGGNHLVYRNHLMNHSIGPL